MSMCVMEQFDKAVFAQVPLRYTGDPQRPVAVDTDDTDHYKVGVSPLWRLGKERVGILPAVAIRQRQAVPRRFRLERHGPGAQDDVAGDGRLIANADDLDRFERWVTYDSRWKSIASVGPPREPHRDLSRSSPLALPCCCCGWPASSRRKSPDQQPVRPGNAESSHGPVVPVRIVRIPLVETAVGTIRAVHETTIGSKLLARVVEVNLKAGQKVRQGDVLVRLDDTDLRAKLQQAQAALDVGRGQPSSGGGR